MLFGALIAWVAILLFAVLVYPGELSLFGPRANRWLYERSAKNYQDKWHARAYTNKSLQERIVLHVNDCVATSGTGSILDLGCGTGRGLRLIGEGLDGDVRYTGVDFSGEMLAQFRSWLETRGRAMSSRVQLVESELGQWAAQPGSPHYGVVLMLEVGEFLPAFIAVVERLALLVPPGGGLVMTRPAHFWWMFFPRRRQSRRALARLLESLGFETPEYIPWRFRYEMVLTRKRSNIPPAR